MATAPPVGTIPIRQQLRAYGVPDSFISYDPETGNVRVGSQTISPAANVQGTTYADPATVRSVADKILAMQPKSEGQIVPPDALQQGVQQALGVAQGMAPQMESIAQMFGPTFNQELTAQTAAADFWRNLAQTAGVFGQAPTNTPFFAQQMTPMSGQITEGRRASQAQEGLAAERNALARQQFQAQQDAIARQEQAMAALAGYFPEDSQGMISALLQSGGSFRDIPALLEASGGLGSGLMDDLGQQLTIDPGLTFDKALETVRRYQEAGQTSQEEINQAMNFVNALGSPAPKQRPLAEQVGSSVIQAPVDTAAGAYSALQSFLEADTPATTTGAVNPLTWSLISQLLRAATTSPFSAFRLGE